MLKFGVVLEVNKSRSIFGEYLHDVDNSLHVIRSVQVVWRAKVWNFERRCIMESCKNWHKFHVIWVTTKKFIDSVCKSGPMHRKKTGTGPDLDYGLVYQVAIYRNSLNQSSC
jgi:hypothetical protein